MHAARKTCYANASNALRVLMTQTCESLSLYCSETVDICAWRRTLRWCCETTSERQLVDGWKLLLCHGNEGVKQHRKSTPSCSRDGYETQYGWR